MVGSGHCRLPACLCVCMFVCMSVCNGQLCRPEKSTDFDETWPYGPLGDLVVRVAYWSRSAPQGGRGGNFKTLKNHKKFIFSKIKNRI